MHSSCVANGFQYMIASEQQQQQPRYLKQLTPGKSILTQKLTQ